MEDPKPPSGATAPADGATVAGAPAVGAPPPVPGGPPPMPGGPPPMPGATVAGAPAVPTLPPTMPGTSFPATPFPPNPFPKMPGTVQMPFGAEPGEAAAPILPTLTGAPVPASQPPAMPPPDRYELGSEIARGGMGRVVQATDTLLGRVVALKEVLSMDADVLRRFARETRITARLEHPSIVPLHDAGMTTGGAPFYVMRKISGRPLEQLVAEAETLPQRLVLVPHIVAAAQAVAHAHERGIVHRDIKPSNILVGELGETIVIDWGLAKVIGETDELSRIDLSAALSASLTAVPSQTGASVAQAPVQDTDEIKTRAGIVFGTPGFMAPEQLRGHPVTEGCDVYALGATLHHMLSRKPPHYAKNADEMMRAAARTPAPPIAELVPGVPAELSTIVDKALAFDPEQRYPDARALAEDLQRFLSGQLVKSHHYSPRERLVRFIRKNRVPVMITAAAVLALLVGGTIAVTRVVDERDRADEHARVAEAAHAEAVLRADRLVLSQARAEAESNPTRAIAMVKPLAEKYWPEVRTIAEAARAHGVAYSLPASKATQSLEMSRDGTRALTAGSDGVVRIYDLPQRTWRAIPAAVGGASRARFADEERRIVVWRDRTLAIVELATGAARTVTAPSRIADLEVVGVTAYWTDEHQTLWRHDLAGAAPAEVPLPEPVTEIAPSPDGRFLALFGRDHLFLLDRTQPAEPNEIMLGVTKAFDWSTDGTGFAALLDEQAILGTMDPVPRILQKRYVGARSYVARADDRLYALGPTGVGMVSREDAVARRPFIGAPAGLRKSRGGALVAGTSTHLVVLSGFGDRSFAIPAGKLELLDASPRSPHVVGAIEDRLLVWNLDDLEPRQLVDQRPSSIQLLGAGHALAAFDAGTQWVDLATGKTTPLGDWAPISAAAAPSGQLACAIDPDHRARLLAPGREPVLLDGTFDAAGFATDTDLLLGNGADGTVQLHDVRTGKRTTLVTSPGKLLDLAWNRAQPAWAAALFGGGSLWRRNLATGAEATVEHVGTAGHLQVLRDGSVVFADGRAIRIWQPGGAVDALAELPRKVVTIGLAGPDHLLALLDDDSAWLVDLAAPGRAAETEPVGASGREVGAKKQPLTYLSMSQDTGMLVVASNGGVNVIDPLVHYTWTLATQPPENPGGSNPTYRDPRISTDGTRVIARLGDQVVGGLVTWSITVPGNGAETARWVESLTNAAIDAGDSSRLIWR